MKLSISNVAAYSENVVAELTTRFDKSTVELGLFVAALSAIDTLVDGKTFNKSITKKFQAALDQQFGENVCSVLYKQEKFNFEIELVHKVGHVYSAYTRITFNLSSGQDRTVDISYLLGQVQRRYDNMVSYNNNLASYIAQPEKITAKLEKIAQALHVLGSEIAEFSNEFESSKYILNLSNCFDNGGKSLFLDGFIKK